MTLYFAYGSNLWLEQIRKRMKAPDLLPIAIGYVHNKKLVFPLESKSRWNGGVASFDTAPSEKLWGAIFELSVQQVKVMDGLEGGYKRISIQAIKENGESVLVETYVANKTGDVLPSNRYMKAIITGAKQCGLPSEYIEKLKMIKTNGKE